MAKKVKLQTLEERITGASIVEKALKNTFIMIISQLTNINKVLSVSTGNGIWDYLVFKNNKDVEEIVAIDIVDCPINSIDKKKLESLGKWIFKRVDPEEKLPFENNTFDALYHHDVIEHVEKPYEFLSEQYRVLKTNGIILVSTPNLLRTMNIVKLFLGKLTFPIVTEYKEELGELTHVQEFTQWNIENYLKEVGFTDIQTTNTFFGVWPLGIKFSELPKKNLGKLLCHSLIITGKKPMSPSFPDTQIATN